jgi:hypothetical protein
MAQTEVLLFAERRDEAIPVIREALGLYVKKGT